MSDLETRIGAPLLSRRRGQVRPTAIGETLLERARRLLAEADQALEDVQRQVQGLAGRVRLGASTGAIAHLLPQALETLGRNHPGIDVQVAVLTSQETLLRLADGSWTWGWWPCRSRRWTAWCCGVPARPGQRRSCRRLARPARITPAWMAERPLILNDASTRLSRLTAEWFAAAGLNPRPRIQLNYNDAIKSLVAAGYGATLLPHEATAPQPDPRIIMRPLRPALWRPLGIAHRAGEVERATRHVLDVLWNARGQPARIRRRPLGPHPREDDARRK